MRLDPDMLPDGDFRFRLGTEPGHVEEFFALSDDAPGVLAERRRWFAESPSLYAGLLPEGVPLLEEFLEHAATWQALSRVERPPAFDPTHPTAALIALGELLEPDFVLMAPDGRGRYVVAGGCVCFPSVWRLTDKLGLTTEETHGPVPGLNPVLAANIDRLMAGMRGGRCVLRWNWSIASAPERNQHPERFPPALTAPVAIEDPWLRLEHQALFALPRTGGIVFGIRIHHVSWKELRENRPAAERMIRTLRTAPHEMLAYKRLDSVRDELARLLE